MKQVLGVFLALFLTTHLIADETPILSNEAKISLLTCSPGDELYSLFGHSALRVVDPPKGIDVVFNYGTFSFDEDFYINFAMGHLNYKLSTSPMQYFMRSYEYEQRAIVEQELNLDSAQRQSLLNFLDWNRQPENRVYLYDFFYNNCSSIIRDVLDTALTEDVMYKNLLYASEPSYRNLIDSYLIYHPWGDFGIDLGLGTPCDKVPDHIEYMFLPDELKRAFDHASIDGRPLVSNERILLTTDGLQYTWSLTQPIPLFWILFGFVALLSAWGYRLKKRLIAIDVLLFVSYGAVGALLFFLWFITIHTGTANNFNMLLWAWPMHLLMLPFLWMPKIRKPYFMVYGAVLAIGLLAFPFWPQMLHLAIVPIMLIGLVRAWVNWRL
ncbi:MAG: DUF4105 domain-containing protein [Salibacteraceae bacterium]